MSLINKSAEEQLVEVFETEFVPVAQQLRERGLSDLLTSIDSKLPSYYLERQNRMMEREEFEINLDDPEDIKRCFRALWNTDEAEVLEKLLVAILALSDNYESVQKVEDVSPLIYTMF